MVITYWLDLYDIYFYIFADEATTAVENMRELPWDNVKAL